MTPLRPITRQEESSVIRIMKRSPSSSRVVDFAAFAIEAPAPGASRNLSQTTRAQTAPGRTKYRDAARQPPRCAVSQLMSRASGRCRSPRPP